MSFEECYSKEWLVRSETPERLENFQCVLCRQIANNAMELTCDEHDEQKDPIPVGELCLMQYLKEHNNQCPVGDHSPCKYRKAKAIRKFVDEFTVMCPLECANQSTQLKEGSAITKTGTQQHCKFKGRIKDLKEHLENECPLKRLECKFKEFGCDDLLSHSDLEQHLEIEKDKHLNLLLTHIRILRQKEIDQNVTLFHLYLLFTLLLEKKKKSMDAKIEQLCSENTEKEDQIEILKMDREKMTAQVESFCNERRYWNETESIEIEKWDEEMQAKNEEIKKMKEEIQCKGQQLLEKENEIERIKRYYQQEILKIRADFEMIKNTFDQKEKQMTELSETKNEQIEQKIKTEYNVDETLNSKQSRIFDVEAMRSLKLMNTLDGHTGCVNSIDCSPFDNGRFLCSGSDDVTVRVWDIQSAKQLKVFNGHSALVTSVQFSSYHYHHDNRNSIICSASGDKTICFWDFETEAQIQKINAHDQGVSLFNFHHLMVVDICALGHMTKPFVCGMSKHPNYYILSINILVVNNNNKSIGVIGGTGYTICSGSYDNTIRLWDIETSKELLVFNGHENTVKSVKYSPYESEVNGGNIICSGSWDRTVRLWDIRSKKEIRVFKGHRNYVSCVGYSPFVNSDTRDIEGYGSIIYSGSWDNTIRFWDVRTSTQLHEIQGKDNGVKIFGFIQMTYFGSMKTIKAYQNISILYRIFTSLFLQYDILFRFHKLFRLNNTNKSKQLKLYLHQINNDVNIDELNIFFVIDM
ncbi:WD-40 repeat protein [Reticulomyxa filosa]|uniref:WD-40 repeat protein n=1 Tax=Reticulomyxa filosa TaxID=46433 RepID=X6NH39_RETFI|nr:WD-40 repeat protein [Reticulomyxa filosa]|eukprot:ETO25213.1 WD-40 repeat protein [Reticulomyxa filosa]